MVLSLPQDKVSKVKKECKHIMLNQQEVTGHSLAHLIGLLTSCIPAVQIAPLHYRGLQYLRSKALQLNHLDYNHRVPISEEAKTDLTWWVIDLNAEMCRLINPRVALMNLETDTATQG